MQIRFGVNLFAPNGRNIINFQRAQDFHCGLLLGLLFLGCDRKPLHLMPLVAQPTETREPRFLRLKFKNGWLSPHRLTQLQ
ncbi:hypothetical protein C1752_01634 [Acaryochloris thomasi RCC1774]|uniref:Uncharacterized protein n=1 Tax=Acaryochloris thomasi RCC1774 TaxID=1764569 RepID=A0A2W1JLG8_9CYAN|nr:hypothetical protein C1752_01634 [Acaryochloris thomasi RCC1774]